MCLNSTKFCSKFQTKISKKFRHIGTTQYKGPKRESEPGVLVYILHHKWPKREKKRKKRWSSIIFVPSPCPGLHRWLMPHSHRVNLQYLLECQ